MKTNEPLTREDKLLLVLFIGKLYMKRFLKTIFGYRFTITFGVITIQDIEESVRDAIIRVNKKELPSDKSSWFLVQTYFTYGYKQIKITDLTGSFDFTVYENSEDNIEELLYKTKKHFDAIK